MKALKGTFIKKNGETREMVFCHLSDVPEDYLASKVKGTGREVSYPAGMELVFDLEADNFRVFNWNTITDKPVEIEVPDLQLD